MTGLTVATFNAKNLIGPVREYYRFERYSQGDYSLKRGWLAEQLVTMNADVVAFQEIFEEDALADVVDEANRIGTGPERPRRALFGRAPYRPYDEGALAFAANSADSGPGNRRPGLAVLSRAGFAAPPEAVQVLDPPLDIPFGLLGGGEAGQFRLDRISRPVQKLRIPVGGRIVTLFNCHLKSPLGEFIRPHTAPHSPELDLLHYDAEGRALGTLRATLRRLAEAYALRKLVLEELAHGHPVIVLGDFNDVESAISTRIVMGERPVTDATWRRRPDAAAADDTYSPEEARRIRAQMEAVRLTSAAALFRRKTLCAPDPSTGFQGRFETVDHILLSRHFHPDAPDRIGTLEHLTVLNDHIADGTRPEAPWNDVQTDHAQVIAHFSFDGLD